MPQKIGKYEILEQIGAGAMGLVYKGMDPRLRRQVAIKTISTELLGNEQQRGRFYREATATARLTHPNIVAIYDLDEEKDIPYIVMEYVDGLNLQTLLEGRVPIAVPQIILLLAQMAEGLHYAHQQGVIHRDVKPSNLILAKSGAVKIVDFGIAQILESDLHTRTGVIIGTPAYMSPEQASGNKVDARTDQYSLGVIAYELFTGCNPFRSETLTGVLLKILQHYPDRQRLLESGCPIEICDMIFKAIEKEREKRFQDLSDFSCICQQALGSSPVPKPIEPSLLTVVLPPSTTASRKENLSDSISHWQREGIRLAGEERYEEATLCFARVLEKDPHSLEAMQWRQKMARLQKDKNYREVLRPLLEEAAVKARHGDYGESNRLYQRVLELDPTYEDALTAMEQNDRQMIAMEKADRLFARALEAAHRQLFEEAFRCLGEIENAYADQEQSTVVQREIWDVFCREVGERFHQTEERSQIREAIQWLEQLLSATPVVAYLCAPNHSEDKNRWLQMLDAVACRWLVEHKSASARQLYQVLLPLFPQHPMMISLEEKLHSAHQDLLQATSLRQSKQRLTAKIHNCLQEGEYARALMQVLRLGREYPQDETVQILLESIRAKLAAAPDPPAEQPKNAERSTSTMASERSPLWREDHSESAMAALNAEGQRNLAERVKQILRSPDLPLLTAETREQIARLAEADRSLAQFTIAVQKDYGLSLQIMKKVCSTTHTHSRLSNISIRQAITLLGSGTIGQIAGAMEVLDSRSGSADLKEILLLSMLTAHHCRETALRVPQIDPEEAFLVGMVRNIGEVCLNAYAPEEYTRFLQHRKVHSSTEREAARAEWGFTFEQLAQKLMDAWHFPVEFNACITYFHQSRQEITDSCLWTLCNLVNFGHQLTQIAYRQPKARMQSSISSLQNSFGVDLQLKKDDLVSILQRGMSAVKPLLLVLKTSSDDLRLERQLALRVEE